MKPSIARSFLLLLIGAASSVDAGGFVCPQVYVSIEGLPDTHPGYKPQAYRALALFQYLGKGGIEALSLSSRSRNLQLYVEKIDALSLKPENQDWSTYVHSNIPGADGGKGGYKYRKVLSAETDLRLAVARLLSGADVDVRKFEDLPQSTRERADEYLRDAEVFVDADSRLPEMDWGGVTTVGLVRFESREWADPSSVTDFRLSVEGVAYHSLKDGKVGERRGGSGSFCIENPEDRNCRDGRSPGLRDR